MNALVTALCEEFFYFFLTYGVRGLIVHYFVF